MKERKSSRLFGCSFSNKIRAILCQKKNNNQRRYLGCIFASVMSLVFSLLKPLLLHLENDVMILCVT